MEHEVLTIGQVAQQLLNNFVKEKRQEGPDYWVFQSSADWQHRIIEDISDSPILCPDIYSAVFRVLLEIFVADNEEQAEEFLWDIEPDISEVELTSWLNASPRHIHYLTIALRENNVKDGGDILRKAYRLFLIDIGMNLINNISRFLSQQVKLEKVVV